MSFARKIKRARGMERRKERERIQKDLRKKARAREAEKQIAPPVGMGSGAGTRIPTLQAKIDNGEIVIVPETQPESAAT